MHFGSWPSCPATKPAYLESRGDQRAKSRPRPRPRPPSSLYLPLHAILQPCHAFYVPKITYLPLAAPDLVHWVRDRDPVPQLLINAAG